MKQKKNKEQLRASLEAEEQRIWKDIDSEAQKLDKKLKKSIKSAAIIGGTMLISYGITKLFTSGKKKSNKSSKASTKASPGHRIVSGIVKAVTPTLVDQITEQTTSNES